MCVYPSIRTRPPRCLWRSDGRLPDANGSVRNAHRLALCSSPRKLADPKDCDATANVWCCDHPAKEVLVTMLSHPLARLGIRLIWAVVEFIATRSLDTVNTIPRCRSPRQEHRWTAAL